MSYADAAASSGPIGAEKVPAPPQLEKTTNPAGNVETVPDDEFKKIKKNSKAEAERLRAEGREHVKDFKKELHDLEEEGKSYLTKFINCARTRISGLVDSVSNTSVESVAEEFKNPVVVAQALVGLGGLVAGYFTWLERHRINTDNRVVVATHSAIITGLILVDGYLFKTYYPQFNKRK